MRLPCINAGQKKPPLLSNAGPAPTRWELDGVAPNVRIVLIQGLVPLALMAARKEMQWEVEELAGPRYGAKNGDGGVHRFGFNGTGHLCPGVMVLSIRKDWATRQNAFEHYMEHTTNPNESLSATD